MKIIVSPAKTMVENIDNYIADKAPAFIDRSELLLKTIRQMSYEELKKMWKCSEKIALENYERFKAMKLQGITPAIFSYQGIQYQYMATNVMQSNALDYVRENLYILSGFYGLVGAFDGVSPYRLEMQAKINLENYKNLYEFWGDSIYKSLFKTGEVVINLASKEYSKVVEPFLCKEDKFVTCIFGEKRDDKIIQKATLAKIARGEMVNFIAENSINDEKHLKSFDRLGFCLDSENSSDNKYIFVRQV